MHVLRSPHSRKSFSGWLTIAQLTGAPLRYHQQQSQLIGDNKPLFPHPPPYHCHQSPSSHNSIQNIQQDNQVVILADRIIIFSFLCISEFLFQSVFFPRQLLLRQFNMYQYISTTLCPYSKIPQAQVNTLCGHNTSLFSMLSLQF